jgi:hypothetical protein
MASMTGDSGDFESTPIEIPAGMESVDDIVRFLVGVLVNQGKLDSNYASEIIELILRRESLG